MKKIDTVRSQEDHDESCAAQLKEFRFEGDQRIAALDRGEGVDGEAIFAEIRKKSEDSLKGG